MNHPRICRSIVMALAAGTLAAAAQGGILWDEGVSGDASGNPASPTNVGTLIVGANTFRGTVNNTGGADQRDYITFVVPAGHTISAFVLNSLAPDNIVWTHFDDGNTSVVPGAGTAASLLAGAHASTEPDNTNLFPYYQSGASQLLAGPGFNGPITAGTYTFLMQQTSPISVAYSVDFIVVPACAAPPAACSGDADGNNMVNFADITSVLANFNSVCP